MGADGPQHLLQDWSHLHPRIEQQARRLFSNLLDQWSRPLQ
jgi:GMP synthase (glutamine-hydrolysing)